MDCPAFGTCLSTWLDGRLSAEDRRAMEAHAAMCGGCRTLEALTVHDLVDVPPIDPPAGLAAAVLARTSGAACERASGQLPALIDGLLAGVDAELVGAHAARCAGCAATARALRELAADLPLLGAIEPTPSLVPDVLAQTSGAWPGRLRARVARVADRWQQLVLRPRLAFEGAYLGSLILVALVGLPGSPLREPEILRTARDQAERTLAGVERATQAARERVESAVPAAVAGVERSWSRTAAPFVEAASQVRLTLRALWHDDEPASTRDGTEASDPASSL